MAPNMCLAKSCYGVTNLLDLTHCPEMEVVEPTETPPIEVVTTDYKPEAVVVQERAGKAGVRLISDEACEKTCGSALIGTSICDKEGVFVAESLCKARFCAGFTSINDLTFCPDGGKKLEAEHTVSAQVTTTTTKPVEEIIVEDETDSVAIGPVIDDIETTDMNDRREAAMERVEAAIEAASEKEAAAEKENPEAVYEDTIVEVVEEFKEALEVVRDEAHGATNEEDGDEVVVTESAIIVNEAPEEPASNEEANYEEIVAEAIAEFNEALAAANQIYTVKRDEQKEEEFEMDIAEKAAEVDVLEPETADGELDAVTEEVIEVAEELEEDIADEEVEEEEKMELLPSTQEVVEADPALRMPVVSSAQCCDEFPPNVLFQKWGNLVCGGSEVSGRCEWNRDFDEAMDICESANARLCSVVELEANVTVQTGCVMDVRKVWTSDSCTVEETGEAGFILAMGGDGSSPSCAPRDTLASTRCCADPCN